VCPRHAGFRAIPVLSVRELEANFHLLPKTFSVGYFAAPTLPVSCHILSHLFRLIRLKAGRWQEVFLICDGFDAVAFARGEYRKPVMCFGNQGRQYILCALAIKADSTSWFEILPCMILSNDSIASLEAAK